MKASDIRQARRVLRLVEQLTADELSCVSFVNDNPDGEGENDCAVAVERYVGTGQPGADEAGMVSQIIHGRNVVSCLVDALRARGLEEDRSLEQQYADGYEDALNDRAARSGRISGAVDELVRAIAESAMPITDLAEKLRFIRLEADTLRDLLVEEAEAF